MNTTEFKTGQKWRVVKASYVNDGMPEDLAHVRNGDLLVVQEGTSKYDREAVIAQTGDTVFITYDDILSRSIYLSEDSPEQLTETSGVPLSAGGTSVPEAAESASQESTDNSVGLLWKFIEASSEYNGHKQLEISEMSLDTLKKTVVKLGDYLSESGETIHDILEIRLTNNGDSWGASVYQMSYWGVGEHSLGHSDRMLFGVTKVTEI